MNPVIEFDKNKEVAKIFNCAEVKDIARNRLKDHSLSMDYLQDTFLCILNMNDYKLKNIFQRGNLKRYVLATYLNKINYYQRGNDVLDKKKKVVPIHEWNIYYEVEPYNPPNVCEEAFDKMHWFNIVLLELYVECGTYKKLEELTDIPTSALFRYVRKAKKDYKALLN